MQHHCCFYSHRQMLPRTLGRIYAYPDIPGIPGIIQGASRIGRFRPLLSRRMVQGKQPAHPHNICMYTRTYTTSSIFLLSMYSDRHVLGLHSVLQGGVISMCCVVLLSRYCFRYSTTTGKLMGVEVHSLYICMYIVVTCSHYARVY